MTYATLEDFYDRLKAEAISNYERPIPDGGISAAQDTILAPGHGLRAGYALRFVGSNLPAPLSAFTLYYALPNGSDFFRVSTTAGGSALDITSAGSGLLSYVVDVEASILRELARQGARIDACLKKHGVLLPLVGLYPDLAALELGLSVWHVLLARGYQVNRDTNPDQDYKVQWEAAERELKDLCSDKANVPAGVPVDTLSANPSEAWDPNARGWLDTRYWPDGGI